MKNLLIAITVFFCMSSFSFAQLPFCPTLNIECYLHYYPLGTPVVAIVTPHHVGSGLLVADSQSLLADNDPCKERYTSFVYLLTAFHVIDYNSDQQISNQELQNIRYFLFHEAGFCNQSDPTAQDIIHVKPEYEIPDVPKVILYSQQKEYDLAVLRFNLKTDDPFFKKMPKLRFKGLSYGSRNLNNGLICINHSKGRPKKIVDTKNPVVRPPQDQVNRHHPYSLADNWLGVFEWDNGVIEEGSSGSPTFDPKLRKVNGVLSWAVDSGLDPCHHLIYCALDLHSIWATPLPPYNSSLDQLFGIHQKATHFQSALPLEGSFTGNADLPVALSTITPDLATNIIQIPAPSQDHPFYYDEILSTASMEAVEFDPKTQFHNTQGLFLAPAVRFAKMLFPYKLFILDNSNINLRTLHLDIPFLQVGNSGVPTNGYDHAELHVDACKTEPIRGWEVYQSAIVTAKFKDTSIDLGIPTKENIAYPALKFSPDAKVWIQAKDINVNQYLESNDMYPFSGDGYLVLKAQDWIKINPLQLTQMNMEMATQIVLSSMDISLNNVNMNLNSRFSTTHFEAQKSLALEKMHYIRDAVQDQDPSEWDFWVGEAIVIKESQIKQVGSGVNLKATTSMDISNSAIQVTNHGAVHISSPLLQAQQFSAIMGETSEGLTPSRATLQSFVGHNPVIDISMPGTVGPQRIPKTAATEATATAAKMNITASSLEISQAELYSRNGTTIKLQSGECILGSSVKLETDKSSKIIISAQSVAAQAQFVQAFQIDHSDSAIAVNKAEYLRKPTQKKMDSTTLQNGPETIESESENNRIEHTEDPIHFSCMANPNPFNHQTVLNIDLPCECMLDIGIYDILGRKIKDLCHTRQRTGRHNLVWNAKDLASGLYFVRIIAQPTDGSSVIVETIKTTLLK